MRRVNDVLVLPRRIRALDLANNILRLHAPYCIVDREAGFRAERHRLELTRSCSLVQCVEVLTGCSEQFARLVDRHPRLDCCAVHVTIRPFDIEVLATPAAGYDFERITCG